MKKIKNPVPDTWEKILKRPTQPIEDIENTVRAVFADVKSNGDRAVSKYTYFFDGPRLNDFRVSQAEIEASRNEVSTDLKKAIQLARENITAFHRAQKTHPVVVETQKGVKCWQEKRPIQKVGLYIPGGRAPLFSTVLMLSIPAKIASCKEIVLCTPPDKEGKVTPAILYTASLCGVTTILKAGGIQAIAGMCFGTKSIPKVYKIFGPGNQYVTAAKQFATKLNTAIDMPAGPSELLIVADDSANGRFVAADMLSQAEHGADSQVILVTTSKILLKEVEAEISRQLPDLSRKEIAQKALQHSILVYMENDVSALELINFYAPEHFMIACRNEDFYIKGVKNAGSVFIGNYTPESAGDYASGTNHVLPTNGYANQYSGVNLGSFMKSMTFQKINKPGLQVIGKAIETMAEAEGLEGHARAVRVRSDQLAVAVGSSEGTTRGLGDGETR